jgi:hypothetical protein
MSIGRPTRDAGPVADAAAAGVSGVSGVSGACRYWPPSTFA